MRDAARLDNFYTILRQYHQTYFPDWRFFQLIDNLQSFAQSDCFYYEEQDTIKLLERFVNFYTNGGM